MFLLFYFIAALFYWYLCVDICFPLFHNSLFVFFIAGWGQELLTRVLSNLSIEIEDIRFAFVEEDIISVLRIGSFVTHSTTSSYVPSFVELVGPWKCIHRILQIRDVSLFLEKRRGFSSSQFPELLERKDHDYIVQGQSFDVHMRAHTTALLYPGLVLSPRDFQEEEMPTVPCGPCLSIEVKWLSSLEVRISTSQLDILDAVIQTKAALNGSQDRGAGAAGRRESGPGLSTSPPPPSSSRSSSSASSSTSTASAAAASAPAGSTPAGGAPAPASILSPPQPTSYDLSLLAALPASLPPAAAAPAKPTSAPSQRGWFSWLNDFVADDTDDDSGARDWPPLLPPTQVMSIDLQVPAFAVLLAVSSNSVVRLSTLIESHTAYMSRIPNSAHADFIGCHVEKLSFRLCLDRSEEKKPVSMALSLAGLLVEVGLFGLFIVNRFTNY